MRFLSLLFVALFAFSVFIQLRTWRKQRRVRPKLIAVSQIAALGSTAVFSALIDRPPSAGSWVVLLAVGALFGVIYGGWMMVDTNERGVVMRYSLPAILTWSALMIITQLTTIFSRSVPIVIYSLAIVNLGVNLGMNGRVLKKYTIARGAAAIGLLVVAAVMAFPVRPAQGQSSAGSPYAGEYVGHFLSYEFGVCGASEQDFDLFIDDAGTVTASLTSVNQGSCGTTWYDAATDSDLDAVVESTVALSCSGSVDGDGTIIYFNLAEANLTCDGAFSEAVVYTLEDGRVVEGESAGGSVQLTMRIDPTGGAGVIVINDSEEEALMSRTGGPADVPRDSVPVDTVVGVTPGVPVDTPAGATPGAIPGLFGDNAPQDPLTDNEALIAIALANLILAGGSLAQLLPLLQAGMSLQDALRLLTERARLASAADPLAGLPRTADGKVIFKAPWEDYGPTAMDPDVVRRILEFERQGLRYSRGYGWATPEAGAAMKARDDILWRATVADHRLVNRIVESQRRLAHWKAAEAQTAKDITRVGELIDEQVARIDERLANMSGEAMAKRALEDAAFLAVSGAGMAADAFVSTTSWAVGPAGHAIRVGYNYAKGVGTVLGEKWARDDIISFSSADVYRAAGLGNKNLLWDYGTDLTLRGAGRLVQTYRGVPIKPLKQVFDEQFVSGLSPKVSVPADLAPVRKTLDGVFGTADGVVRVDPKKALELYKNGGMKDLARLEAAGGITRAEAAALNDALKGAVDDATERALPAATKLFQKGNPMVRVKEVIIGDAGSSARGGVRSVLTDADRTVVGVFDADDVAQYASTRGISKSDAVAELNAQLTQIYKKQVVVALKPTGLSGRDVGLEAYSGYGGTGPADTYPRGFAETTQATGGRAIAYRPGGQVHAVGGEAVVDQWRLGLHEAGAPVSLASPKIPVAEYAGIAEQQVMAAGKAVKAVDVKTAAKALDRLGYVAERTAGRGGPGVDRPLLDLARSVRRDAQGMRDLMSASGLTDKEFVDQVLEETSRYHEAISQ